LVQDSSGWDYGYGRYGEAIRKKRPTGNPGKRPRPISLYQGPQFYPGIQAKLRDQVGCLPQVEIFLHGGRPMPYPWEETPSST